MVKFHPELTGQVLSGPEASILGLASGYHSSSAKLTFLQWHSAYRTHVFPHPSHLMRHFATQLYFTLLLSTTLYYTTLCSTLCPSTLCHPTPRHSSVRLFKARLANALHFTPLHIPPLYSTALHPIPLPSSTPQPNLSHSTSIFPHTPSLQFTSFHSILPFQSTIL